MSIFYPVNFSSTNESSAPYQDAVHNVCQFWPLIAGILMVKYTMSKKTLKQTNPYLQDPELARELIYQSVSSSTAVEGVLTDYLKLSESAEKKLKEVIAVHESTASYE